MLAVMQMSARIAVALPFLALVAGGCDGCKKDGTDTKPAASSSASVTSISIPDKPLAGKLGDQPFTLKKITLLTAKGFGEWRMSVEGSTPTAEKAAVRLPVKSALGPGKSFETGPQALTFGGHISGITVTNGEMNTSSSEATYRVEITKWDVKPCPTDDSPTHDGGLASGRIFIKVPPANTEIAGTFTDAVVTYGQTPDWTYH
jgi:hypothetical protein